MTGFGRAVVDGSMGQLVVEIQSVNRKYLEVTLFLPKEWSRFESEVRKWIGEAISRGQVVVRVTLLPNERGQILPDVKALKALKKGWEKIAQETGLSTQSIDLPFLLQYLPLQGVGEEGLTGLKEAVKGALKSLMQMRMAEGKELQRDLKARLKELGRMIEEVAKLTPHATQKMKQKLLEKMGEAVEERLLREVALFAEKVDITEEITRFRSHLSQFEAFLKESDMGRKMDFLLQEMGREVNTIGSKSMEAKISHLVVDMKSALEKMREQVQNIE